MPDSSLEALYEQYPVVIAQMPEEFSSHQFIQRLAQQNQRLYIEALYTVREQNAPFQTIHRSLAQHLTQYADRLQQIECPQKSKDIFGKLQETACWRRVQT